MTGRTVIFTGSRNHPNPQMVHQELRAEQALALAVGARLYVAVGDCKSGIDAEVRWWCRWHLRKGDCLVYEANWKLQGKAAGPIRNRAMIAAHRDAAVCVALPLQGPPHLSRGTWDCHAAAVAAGIPVRVVYPEPASG